MSSESVYKKTSVPSGAQFQTCNECEKIYAEENELDSVSFKKTAFDDVIF
jgi:hypothetical protein